MEIRLSLSRSAWSRHRFAGVRGGARCGQPTTGTISTRQFVAVIGDSVSPSSVKLEEVDR